MRISHLEAMGLDWRAILAGISPYATATGLATALSPIVGGMPRVLNNGDYSTIQFSQEQEERLADWIVSLLDREPGPVRIESGPVAVKVVLRKYWPWLTGLAGAGFFLGRISKRGAR